MGWVDCGPSQFLHNCARGLECLLVDLRDDGGLAFDALGEVRCQEAARDQLVDLQPVTLEILCRVLRKRQGRVIFHLLVVHEALVELHGPALPKLLNKGLQLRKLPLSNGLDPARSLLRVCFRQVPGIRTRVADELGFIEILRHFQGVLCREPEALVGLFLEIGKVVQQLGLFLFRLGGDRCNIAGQAGQLVSKGLCVFFLFETILILPTDFVEPFASCRCRPWLET